MSGLGGPSSPVDKKISEDENVHLRTGGKSYKTLHSEDIGLLFL